MININKFKENENPEIYKAVIEFNKFYQNHPKTASQKTYYELWQETQKSLPLSVWKDFVLDKRVREWYSTELDIALENNLQRLAQIAGTNNSTATNQALASLLNYQKDKMQEESNKYFIYSMIPLNTIEEHLDNVRIIKTIPKEISDAITKSRRD